MELGDQQPYLLFLLAYAFLSITSLFDTQPYLWPDTQHRVTPACPTPSGLLAPCNTTRHTSSVLMHITILGGRLPATRLCGMLAKTVCAAGLGPPAAGTPYN